MACFLMEPFNFGVLCSILSPYTGCVVQSFAVTIHTPLKSILGLIWPSGGKIQMLEQRVIFSAVIILYLKEIALS